MESYLKEFYQEDITNLLNDSNDCVHVSINLNLTHLKNNRQTLFSNFLNDVKNVCQFWDNALLEVQKHLLEDNIFLEPGFQIKENCHVRFVNFPQSEQRLNGVFPNNDHIGLFVQVKGSVVRITQSRLLEHKREYSCNRCKEVFTIEAKYEEMFVFVIPKQCPNSSGICKGTLYPKNSHPKPEYCIDYQELRIQEHENNANTNESSQLEELNEEEQEEEEREEVVVPVTRDNENISVFHTHSQQNNFFKGTKVNERTSTKKNFEDEIYNKFQDAIDRVVDFSNQDDNGVISSFTKSIAAQLNSLPEIYRCQAMHEIQGILSKHTIEYMAEKKQKAAATDSYFSPNNKLEVLECIHQFGTIERRWRPFTTGKRSEVIISMRALGICKDEEKVNFNKDYSEQLLCVRAQWQDSIDQAGLFSARDTIIGSICPDIHGMYMVKLAIALSLCSGVEQNSAGSTTRGHSHLLLVGDPGLAKSKLLKEASKIALRSVHTTGMGCSAAGLTAAAVKEDGEWQLEAGALVLADGGVCCIDEFNLMRENDKASIHEAMEQQTISMAKAGLVCKLSTRCVILAATNPKNLFTMSETEGTSALNIGIGSPLLSRFDIVLILRDERDSDWDTRVADHILNFALLTENYPNLWDHERLQSHFLAVHEITPKITQDASTILATYYHFCRSDPHRDPARTTVRLLDSLNRLAQAHARLTFRDKVEGIDAIFIIRLMEFSWGFGRLLKSMNILKEELPLGPNEQQISEILKLLKLQRLEEAIINQSKMYNDCYQKNRVQIVERNIEKRPFEIDNLEKQFGYNKNVKKLRKSDGNTKENVIEKISIINSERIDKEMTKKCSEERSMHPECALSENHTENVNPINVFGNFDDFDDVDLELDVDFNSMIKQKTSTEKKTEAEKKKKNYFCDNDLNLHSITKPKIIITEIVQIKNNVEINKPENIRININPGPSKEISKATLTKLNCFKNSDNYKERSAIDKSSPVTRQDNEKHNSTNGLRKACSVSQIIQSSSLILASQNDDLECLEFDL